MPEARRPVAEDVPGVIEALFNGDSLRKACEARGIHPGHMSALLSSDDRLWAQYMRARALQGDDHGHRVLEVVNKVETGKIAPDVARAMLNGLQWAAGRMNRKFWGDKTQHEHMGEGGGPVMFANLTPEQRKARIQELEAKKRAEADVADDG